MKEIKILETPGKHAELKSMAAELRISMTSLFGPELRRMLERYKRNRKADPSSLGLERQIAELERKFSISERENDSLCSDAVNLQAELSGLYGDTSNIPVELARKLEGANQRVTELEQELATIYATYGPDFDKIGASRQ